MMMMLTLPIDLFFSYKTTAFYTEALNFFVGKCWYLLYCGVTRIMKFTKWFNAINVNYM